jgi:hypothetical protein
MQHTIHVKSLVDNGQGVVAAGPIIKSPDLLPYRVVLRFLPISNPYHPWVVHNEIFFEYPILKETLSGFQNGHYFGPPQGFRQAFDCFVERLKDHAEKIPEKNVG